MARAMNVGRFEDEEWECVEGGRSAVIGGARGLFSRRVVGKGRGGVGE